MSYSASDDEEIRGELERIFGNGNVKFNWDIAKLSGDLMTHEAYGPRPDFAVGPFNTKSRLVEKERAISAIDRVYEGCLRGFVEPLRGISDIEDRGISVNTNPRCFLAMEIESEHPTSKHKLGGLINSSLLGRVGIMVGTDLAVVNKLKRIRKYLNNAYALQKISWRIDNVFIVERGPFLRLLRDTEDHNIDRFLRTDSS